MLEMLNPFLALLSPAPAKPGAGQTSADTPVPAKPAKPRGQPNRSPRRGKSPREQPHLESVVQRRKMAQRPPSFTDLLPYVAYDCDERLFVMKDGCTLGVMFELGAIPTEAQPPAYLAERAARVQEALQAFPESDDSPWIVQFFLSDDRNIAGLNKSLRDYVAAVHQREPERQQAVLGSPVTQAVLDEVRSHLAQVSKPEGLFTDTLVTGQVWRGQQRRVRCCIYKRFDETVASEPASASEQIEAMAVTLEATFTEAGVAVRRCNGQDLYEWLLPFFNRKVPWAKDAADLLRLAPYPGDNPGAGRPARPASGDDPGDPGQAPILGCDLAELLNFSEPKSDLEHGCFEFDGVPVRALVLQNLRTSPQIGHFSAELPSGKESFARFDRLPPGSMLSIAITVRPQYLMERHIERIRDASRAKNAQAQAAHKECELVLARMIEGGDKLYPMQLTLYLTGSDYAALNAAIADVNALLVPTGLHFIDPRQDLAPLDAFMRGLPFNYDSAFDEKHLKRSRLTFASQIAALLPVYGRSRGTPHPGMWFWNRGGEPLWLDPLNKSDRKKNAHMLVLGPTGAGKSATLNYLAMMTMAIHRPRLVIVDAGNSFGLLVEWFKAMGLSTYSVNLSAGQAEVSLPPFVHAGKLLEDRELMGAYQAAGSAADPGQEKLAEVLEEAIADTGEDEDEDEDTSEQNDKRDLLGEMLIAAILMITGGEPREQERMTRADRALVSRAIIAAAIRARQEGRPHPLTQDVANELTSIGHDQNLSARRQERAEEMGLAMMGFTQGLRGALFNREGHDWPDADVILVEMGTLTNDGYEDALAVAYTSLIDMVQGRGERYQAQDRPQVFLTDEAHMITTNELLGPKIAKATKMWRKLNTWLWLATQNLEDFPGSMSRVLSMCEFWMLLTMDRNEIEQVTRFRTLTSEQRHMIESARKEPPKYTEGVIITASGQYLFRNVPPALPIALAMTEGHEKAQRRRIMQERGCTELQAAMFVAQQIASQRG